MPQDKNFRHNATVTKLYRFVGCRHCQQPDLFLLEHCRNACCAVPIRISLHDTDDLCLERDARPDGLQVVADCCQIDPAKLDVLMAQLDAVGHLDYLVAQHAEQDHSGSIPAVLARYPDAVLVTNPKAKELLQEHLDIADDRFRTVADGETLSLGDKTLRFIYLPWVHWPETMGTYIEEDRVLLSCDFFGSHRAQARMFAERNIVMHGAKRYYAEIDHTAGLAEYPRRHR